MNLIAHIKYSLITQCDYICVQFVLNHLSLIVSVIRP